MTIDNVNEVGAEPSGVVTAAIAAVTPPPAGPLTGDLKATIPSPDAEPTAPATV